VLDEVLVEDDVNVESDESNTSEKDDSDIYWEEREWTVLLNGEVNALSSWREDGSTSKTITPLLFHS
jgi:hypothetical protein